MSGEEEKRKRYPGASAYIGRFQVVEDPAGSKPKRGLEQPPSPEVPTPLEESTVQPPEKKKVGFGSLTGGFEIYNNSPLPAKRKRGEEPIASPIQKQRGLEQKRRNRQGSTQGSATSEHSQMYPSLEKSSGLSRLSSEDIQHIMVVFTVRNAQTHLQWALWFVALHDGLGAAEDFIREYRLEKAYSSAQEVNAIMQRIPQQDWDCSDLLFELKSEGIERVKLEFTFHDNLDLRLQQALWFEALYYGTATAIVRRRAYMESGYQLVYSQEQREDILEHQRNVRQSQTPTETQVDGESKFIKGVNWLGRTLLGPKE